MDSFDLSLFHFLRPELLWLLLAVPVFWLLGRVKASGAGQWQQVCDANLLPYLIHNAQNKDQAQSITWLRWLGPVLWTVMVLAIAGPSWSYQETPVFQRKDALIIVLDLSASMMASDIKPDRLNQARFKLRDLLESRKEGQTALVVFAAEAFTVSPLTDDHQTIEALLPALSPDIMPAQGGRMDKGLKKAQELIVQAGVAQGQIVLITDSKPNSAAINLAEKLRGEGHQISVLAVGTPSGSPIPQEQGGFLTDAAGNIVLPRLDMGAMRKLAQAGGGLAIQSRVDPSDIALINRQLGQVQNEDFNEDSNRSSEIWKDQGIWLLPLIVPLFALLFRKGFLFIWLICLLPVLPSPAQAVAWQDLWQRGDQQAWSLMQSNQANLAVDKAVSPQLQAQALYESARFDEAAQTWSGLSSAEDFYNMGNALARQQKFDEAIAAYEQALERQPDMEDAAFNRDLLKQAQQEQQQQQQENQDNQNQDNQQDEQQEQDQSGQSDSSEQENSEQSDQQQDSSDAENDESEPESEQASESEQQNSEQSEQEQQSSESEQDQGESEQQAMQSVDESQLSEEEKQALEQWLKQIPDDPGGLLRRKFLYQYQSRKQTREEQDW